MDFEWKRVEVIGLLGVYTLSVLSYRGIYWPLRGKYEGLPNRRSWQKRDAILFALMGTIGFLRAVIFSEFKNQSLYKISYWLMLFVTVVFLINHFSFVKQKNENINSFKSE